MSVEEEDGFDMSLLDPNRAEPTAETEGQEVVEEAAEDNDVEVPDNVELPEDKAPQSDRDSQRADLIDKEVQKLQQLRATYEREISKLEQDKSEKQVERVEKAKTKLDKYLNAADDVDPYQGVTDIASEVMADRSRVEALLQEAEALRRESAEREMRREAEMAQIRFQMDYPELKGQYSNLVQRAHEAVLDEFGDSINELTSNVYVKVANRELVRLANEAVASMDTNKAEKQAKSAKQPIEDTSKKPKAANIVKTKSGAKVDTPQDSEARAENIIAQLSGEFFGR